MLKELIEKYQLTEFKVTDKDIVNRVNGSDFIFKGLHHNEQNVKSTEGIDIAWVEEAQTVSESSLDILTPTVRKPGSQIVYTYNRLKTDDPVHVRLVKEGRPNTLVLNINYDVALKHGWMPEVLRIEMEDDKEKRPNRYRHKWLGEPNNVEGRIYKDWSVIETIPHEASLVRRGLDFGYSVDPTAIVDLYYYNGGYIISERLYRTGMLNNNIAVFLQNLEHPSTLVVADSAEPKSIAEVQQGGVSIVGVQKKGGDEKGYLSYSIDYMQQQRISVTSWSGYLLDEYESYYWATNKEGKPLNVPEGGKDHALDAARYAFDGLRPTQPDKTVHRSNNLSEYWG